MCVVILDVLACKWLAKMIDEKKYIYVCATTTAILLMSLTCFVSWGCKLYKNEDFGLFSLSMIIEVQASFVVSAFWGYTKNVYKRECLVNRVFNQQFILGKQEDREINIEECCNASMVKSVTVNTRELSYAPEVAQGDLNDGEKSVDDINPFTIESNTKETITIIPRNLYFAKAEGNYVDICFIENGRIKNSLLRININAVEGLLKKYPNIVRCHRSYIVNLKHVRGREGRANGVTLLLDDDMRIPVSRSYDKYIRKVIKPKTK